MRHADANRKFGRERKGRRALMRGLARSLILKGGIETTEAKAKSLRPFVEELVTKSKQNTPSSRRLIMARLDNNKEAVKALFDTVAPKYMSRAGGYTRILRLGQKGKSARAMAHISFV